VDKSETPGTDICPFPSCPTTSTQWLTREEMKNGV
jgi:hypothetical protein